MFYTVRYLDWQRQEQTVKLDVRQCVTGTDEIAFYAWHADRLGCGKDAPTPEGACNILVSDHGYGMLSCKRIPPTVAYIVTVTRSDVNSVTTFEFPTAKLAAQAALLAARMLADEPSTHILRDYLIGRLQSACGWSNRKRTAHVEVRRTLIER